ncbi:hypothetical protein BC830DRAFT_740533 [Chytriomyces sp. MP71]|nr:hypothetical protein BC830DRAFT_740533 [Chytriomyces sp. MP71]
MFLQLQNSQNANQRDLFTSLLLLYLICYIPTCKKPFSFDTKAVMRILASLPQTIQSCPGIKNTLKLQRALLDNVDYVSFHRTWARMNWKEKRIAKHIVPHVRMRTLDMLTKAYFTYPASLLADYIVLSEERDRNLNADDAPAVMDELLTILHERFGDNADQRCTNGIVQLRIPKKKVQ